MSSLLADYDNNSCEEDINTSCLCIDTTLDRNYREYVPDFIGYTFKKNMNYKIELNLDKEKIIILNTDYYENKKNFYIENNSRIDFDYDTGHIHFIIKDSKNINICSLGFNYTLNNPIFNVDVIKIKGKKYNIYVFLKREKNLDKFHIYKIIYTIPN